MLPCRIVETAESCLSCSSLTYQAPVVFRFSLLFMLGTEMGEEFVAAAGSTDVSPSSMNRLQKSDDPDQHSNRMDSPVE